MRNNDKGCFIVECLIVLILIAIVVVMILGAVSAIDKKKAAARENKKEIVESSEVVKDIERYMVILYKDNGLCDTLYSNGEGTITSVGEFIFYKSDDFDIVSKHSIISIPIKDVEDKDSDMYEFESGIDYEY